MHSLRLGEIPVQGVTNEAVCVRPKKMSVLFNVTRSIVEQRGAGTRARAKLCCQT